VSWFLASFQLVTNSSNYNLYIRNTGFWDFNTGVALSSKQMLLL